MIIFFLHCFVFGVLLILKIRVVGEFDSDFFWFSVFFFFLWVFGTLMGLLFAHHTNFGGFSEMEVGCVPRISMGLLIIEVFFFQKWESQFISDICRYFDVIPIYWRYIADIV